MSNNITIVPFSEKYSDRWDRFVMEQSCNGTFLQTRNFLNYHPKGRFTDSSLLAMRGSEIVAVLPANSVDASGKKTFISHQGSTFGGIVLHKSALKIRVLEELFCCLDGYFENSGYSSVILKQPGKIFCKNDMDLLEYFFYNKGYTSRLEVGFYIDFDTYNDDIIANYSSSRRRDYKYSLKQEYQFSELTTPAEIAGFYMALLDNYRKFGKTPVHTLEDLVDFYSSRLKDTTRFFGVFYDSQLVAGSMVFCFDKAVYHTQYLAVVQDMSDQFVNEYLYTSLIKTAKEERVRYLSFGTSTFESGRVLNTNLAQYKESFGTKQYNNCTFVKHYGAYE